MKNLLPYILILLALCYGCSTAPQFEVGEYGPPKATICLNADLAYATDFWVAECSRRYPNFVMVMAHGQELGGQWFAWPDQTSPAAMTELVADLRRYYPNTRIILVSCNSTGLQFDAPGVTYARRSVWTKPDRVIDSWEALRDFPEDGIGNIFEFEENAWERHEATHGDVN